MNLLRYERIEPDSECVSPDGHTYVEEFDYTSPLPQGIWCPKCGDQWSIVTFERRQEQTA